MYVDIIIIIVSHIVLVCKVISFVSLVAHAWMVFLV